MQEEFHSITLGSAKNAGDAQAPIPRFDPKTGQPLVASAQPAGGEGKMNFDPKTGQPLSASAQAAAPPPKMNFDPKTGQPLVANAPLETKAKINFDPKTGQPLSAAAPSPASDVPRPRFDPKTGAPLPAAPATDKPAEDIGSTAIYQLGLAREAPADDAINLAAIEQKRREAENRRTRRRSKAAQSPAPEALKMHQPRADRRKGRVRRGILKVLGVVAVFLISVVGLLYGVITVICTGPFPNAKQLFVVSVTETSAVKFLAYIHFTEEEVNEILAANTVIPIEDVTDVTLPFEPLPEAEESTEEIEIHEVSGNTFVGKMMIIKDPSRVELRCLDSFGSEVRGKQVEQFATEYGATAAINAGFFDDPGGVGKGGQPLGLLIQGGVIRNGGPGMVSTIIGFDTDNHLIVGKMSGQEALDMNIRDAVTVEPTIMPPLIVNGNPVEYTGNGSGLNPRTALGQRADGAVLMLVIDGRQPHSLGATIEDCLQLMMDYGAINASMQDGGSSSVMWYEGETINVCSSLYGSRSQPSSWLVF